MILSVGDADEDEHAATESGIAFIRVVRGNEDNAWKQAALLIADRAASRKNQIEKGERR